MENKIDLVKLLKDCPKGMKLDCLIFDGLEFDHVKNNSVYPIVCRVLSNGAYITHDFTKYGCYNPSEYSKCVIFPPNKTTWEGFVPPCKFKDGDIIYIKDFANKSWISIYKKIEDDLLFTFVDISLHDNKFLTDSYLSLCEINTIVEQRIATEEEKNKLFSIIKTHGYQWNEDTKSLEKLNKPKFDINTLILFESKVLVRDFDHQIWKPAIFGGYIVNSVNAVNSYYMTIGGISYLQLIPYKGNEHLCNKSNDCSKYYKIWKN